MLVHEKTGAEIRVGDTVETFRGESCKVTLLRPTEGQNGRVYVRLPGDSFDSEFFPGVIGAKFV